MRAGIRSQKSGIANNLLGDGIRKRGWTVSKREDTEAVKASIQGEPRLASGERARILRLIAAGQYSTFPGYKGNPAGYMRTVGFAPRSGSYQTRRSNRSSHLSPIVKPHACHPIHTVQSHRTSGLISRLPGLKKPTIVFNIPSYCHFGSRGGISVYVRCSCVFECGDTCNSIARVKRCQSSCKHRACVEWLKGYEQGSWHEVHPRNRQMHGEVGAANSSCPKKKGCRDEDYS